jgi:zinc protease
MKHEQVVQLYREYLGARGEVAVVGDFDPEPVLAELREMFDDWESQKAYERIPRKVFANIPGGVERIDTPDKANATYMAGYVFSMKDTDPGYASVLIGNFVLGGGTLSSRLGDRVRQKDGLSYGVASSFAADTLDPRASFTIYAISNPQNMPKVVTAIEEEVQRLLKEGVTPEELERAKNGFLRQLQIRRTSDNALVNVLAEDLHYGRTFSYYRQLEDAIQKLTPEQVVQGMKRNLDPKKLVIATAGDFSDVGEGAPQPASNDARKK